MSAAVPGKRRLARVGQIARNPALTREIVTPEGVVLPIQVASAGSRAGALMLDILIIVGIAIIIGIAMGMVQSLFSRLGAVGGPAMQFLQITGIVLGFLLRNAYFLYFELGERGATWGKRSVGIRVASHDGGRLTAEAVIARNLLRDIELFLPLMFMAVLSIMGQAGGITLWLGFLWVAVFLFFPLFNRDRMRCGDLIAGTWVIEAPRTDLSAVVTPSDSGYGADAAVQARYQFTDEELSVYGEYELQTLEKVLRASNPDALVSVCAAICRKIGWNPGAGEERLFLEAYYTQLRARLESDMRFGKRRADKYSDAE